MTQTQYFLHIRQNDIKSGGNASEWIACVEEHFPKGTVSPGTNPRSVANFSIDDVSKNDVDGFQEKILRKARLYISRISSQTSANVNE